MGVQATTLEVAIPSPDVPVHVAIIMDGNGRWARARGLPRGEGHRRGIEALRVAVRYAGRRGIRFLTLFSFSSENWSRPQDEVQDLMNLLRFFIRRDLAEMKRNNVRVRVVGDRANLAGDICSLIAEAEQDTAENTGLQLVVAFNYGSRDEIVRATRKLAVEVKEGRLAPGDIDQNTLATALDTSGIPDPDLVLRTSGEQRISNFLLWQAAYAEFLFPPVLWPDFTEETFEAALQEFAGRERRFGGLAVG